MWPEWDDPRVCFGGRQQGKYRSSFLIWILQTKGNIKSDLTAGVLMAFSPSPLPLSIFCAPPREASRQKCALAELYSYKMLLTTDRGKKPSEWLSVLWTNTSTALKVPFLFQEGLSVRSLPWLPAQRSVVPRMSSKKIQTSPLFIGKLAPHVNTES